MNADQLAYEASGAGDSQAGRILKHLQTKPNEWVPMPLLARLSGAYAVHSRISDLRRAGHIIKQRTERSHTGVNHSSYQLVVAASAPAPASVTP